MANKIYRASWKEYFYRVKVDDISVNGSFGTEKERFFFLSKVMETFSRTQSLLDIASIKFRTHKVEMVLVANFHYSVQEVRNHLDVALNNYVVARYNSTIPMENGEYSVWVQETQDGWRRRSAFNSSIPQAYLMIVCGKSGKLAFPDDEAKKYYLQLMKLMQKNMPVEVVAYSLTANSAYFVMTSMDQTELSMRRYINAVNREYIKYYNTVERFKSFTPVGNLFTVSPYIKQIKESGKDKTRTYPEVLDYIAKVHAQPVVQGLASSYATYPFSSYNQFFVNGDDKKLNSLDMLAVYLRLNSALNLAYYSIDRPIPFSDQYNKLMLDYKAAHEKQPEEILDRFIIRKKEIFDCVVEQALASNRVLNAKDISIESFAKVVIEINEIGDYPYDMIVEKILPSRKRSYNLIVLCAVEMIKNRAASYDDVVRRLGLHPNGNQLIYDIILNICEDYGYSYDYILQKMELAYPNVDLLIGLIEYANKTRGYQKEHIIKMFGLYDRRLIDQIL